MLPQVLKVPPVHLEKIFVFESDTFVSAKDVTENLSFEEDISYVGSKKNPSSVPSGPFDGMPFIMRKGLAYGNMRLKKELLLRRSSLIELMIA